MSSNPRKSKIPVMSGFQDTLEDVRVFLEKGVGISSGKDSHKDKNSKRTSEGGLRNTLLQQNKERVHRFRNVFAKPLEMVEEFVAPVHDKTKTQRETLDAALEDNFIFRNMDEKSRETLLDAMEPLQVKKGLEIIKQGELGDYFYVIEKGIVSYIVNGKHVGKGEAGSCFGELALLYDAPRAATVVCETDCDLWRVGQMTVRKLKAARAIHKNKVARDLTYQIDFLKGLSDEQKKRFADALSKRIVRKNEVLVRKGEPCKEFFMIKVGKVHCTDIQIGETNLEDLDMGPGDFFGQANIETGAPWEGNAVVETDGIVYWMSRDNFNKILGSENLAVLIAKSGEARFLSAIPIFANTDLDPLELGLLADLVVDKKFSKGFTFCSRNRTIAKPAVYLIRTGAVTVKTRWRGENKVLRAGEVFGADELVPLAGKDKVVAMRTIVCTEDATIGVLTLDAIKSVVLSTKRLGKKLAKHAKLNKSITLDSLKKYKILGAGTFGQVWLVSEKDKHTKGGHFLNKDAASAGHKTPYALKIQYKRDLIGYNQVDGVINEKNIMEAIEHPFVISLINTYKDDLRVYMLIEVLQGGELFGLIHTKQHDGIPESEAIFYGAGILEGLSYMHRRKILHRDLKGENVLMDSDGYCVLIDLGFAKVVPDKTYTCCGTPIFMAPEVLLGEGHNQGADYWSLGVLIYDMIVGYTPFYTPGMTQMELYEGIVRAKFKFPNDVEISREAQNLIKNLLYPDPSLRIGCLARGDLDIRDHLWFKDIDFAKLFRKELEAPWVPKLKDPFDVSKFDDWSKLEKEKKDLKPLTKKEDRMFDGF